jgi:hypothetical protein
VLEWNGLKLNLLAFMLVLCANTDARDVKTYVLVIGDLVTIVMKSNNNLILRGHALIYTQDSDDDSMDTDDDGLVAECTRHINSPRLADAVSTLADSQPATNVTAAICRLSYFLLSSARPLDVGGRYGDVNLQNMMRCSNKLYYS